MLKSVEGGTTNFKANLLTWLQRCIEIMHVSETMLIFLLEKQERGLRCLLIKDTIYLGFKQVLDTAAK